MGFSLLFSPVVVKLAVQSVHRKFGSVNTNDARRSSGPARPPIVIVSAFPRTLFRVYSKLARGPWKVCWLVLNVDGSPIGGRPGRATVPVGTLPPRFTNSYPKPYVIVLRRDSCTFTITSSVSCEVI